MQKRIQSAMGALALTLGATTTAWAAGPVGPGAAQFDQLKKLVGTWEMSFKPGKDEKMPEGPAEVTYKLSAGGNAVVETLFVGLPHEMTTVYHLDGGDLVLTHYCVAGNQPHMKAEASKDPKTIAFRFAGGANINAAKDMHMHEASLKFVDGDHVHAEWTLFQDGKQLEVKSFDYTRKTSK